LELANLEVEKAADDMTAVRDRHHTNGVVHDKFPKLRRWSDQSRRPAYHYRDYVTKAAPKPTFARVGNWLVYGLFCGAVVFAMIGVSFFLYAWFAPHLGDYAARLSP
jgi:hypothetical protein